MNYFNEIFIEFSTVKTWKKFLCFVLIIFALVSVAQGLLNAVTHSQDMQWSPSVLLRDGINPYSYYLNGNDGERIILSQAPNYAQALYVFFQPLAYLQWDIAKPVWAIINISLSIVVVLLISKFAGISSLDRLLIMLIFLSSTSVRNSIGNGQQSLLCLLFFSMILYRGIGGSFITGISYLKYSFAPPLAFYILFKRGFLHLLVSCMIGFFGLIIFFYMQDDPFFEVVMQPLKVSSISVGVGVADFMSLMDSINSGSKGFAGTLFYYSVPLVFSLLSSIYCARKLNNPIAELSVLALTALISFKHLGYDYVFLLPGFVYFVHNFSYASSKLGIVFIIYHWFGIKLIKFIEGFFGFAIDNLIFIFINIITLLLLLVLVIYLENKINKSALKNHKTINLN
jgi:Glycosyltransferase family 87